MTPKERTTDHEDIARQPETPRGIDVDCLRNLRWVKLTDTVERSLYWLIPAATLAYLVFRILRLLGS
jgi:hypothetical protein